MCVGYNNSFRSVMAILEILFECEIMYENVMLGLFVTLCFITRQNIYSIKIWSYHKNNWMNRKTCTNCHIICHTVINCIRMIRNNYFYSPYPLSNIRLDCYEDFFRPWVINKKINTHFILEIL